MINFFRKTRKKMAKNNKPLKYIRYAIGEIVLVVIGILIALSVSNWNDNRKLRNQELLLLNNLKMEMQNNLFLIENYLETKEKRIKDANVLLSFTDPDYIQKKEDSLARKFISIFNLDNYKAEIMVLNAAKNSNSIKLIRNQQIKTNLAKWEQSLKSQMQFVDFGNEHFSNSLIPIISNYYPLKNIPYDAGNGNIQELSKHNNEFEKMFRSREFENSLYRIKNFERARTRQANELKEFTLELIQELNKELNIL